MPTPCHYPPGTSKWNPDLGDLVRLCTADGRDCVGFIRRTTTRTGLTVTATQLEKTYETGVKVSKTEFNAIQLARHEVCSQWNYTIRPHPKNTE